MITKVYFSSLYISALTNTICKSLVTNQNVYINPTHNLWKFGERYNSSDMNTPQLCMKIHKKISIKSRGVS